MNNSIPSERLEVVCCLCELWKKESFSPLKQKVWVSITALKTDLQSLKFYSSTGFRLFEHGHETVFHPPHQAWPSSYRGYIEDPMSFGKNQCQTFNPSKSVLHSFAFSRLSSQGKKS